MPSTLTRELLQKYAPGHKVFVETGTAQGEGVQVALDFGFECLYSIESNLMTYLRALERFVDHGKVHILLGDSAVVLPGLLAMIQESCFFWLDAHWSHGEEQPEPGVSYCPIIGDLKAIAGHKVKGHTILVDDCRYFWGGLPEWGGITIGDILPGIFAMDAGYWVTFEAGVSPLDILVAKTILVRTNHPVMEAVEAYEGMKCDAP